MLGLKFFNFYLIFIFNNFQYHYYDCGILTKYPQTAFTFE